MDRNLSPLFTWRSVLQSPEAGLPSTARHVGLGLSLHMSEKGDSCFPGIRLLAEECGLAKSTISQAVKELEAGGFLRVKRGGGRGKRTEYSAVIPVWFTELSSRELSSSETVSENGPSDDQETVHLTTLNGPSPRTEDVMEGVIGGREAKGAVAPVETSVENSVPAILPTETEKYLVEKLHQRGEDWQRVTLPAVADFNRRWGPEITTTALQRMAEETDTEIRTSAWGLLEAACEDIAEKAELG
jgi:DNA-binding transcriptional MocR family regulator